LLSDEEFGEKTVSVLLDGQESDMIFIDHPASEMSVSFIFVDIPHFSLFIALLWEFKTKNIPRVGSGLNLSTKLRQERGRLRILFVFKF